MNATSVLHSTIARTALAAFFACALAVTVDARPLQDTGTRNASGRGGSDRGSSKRGQKSTTIKRKVSAKPGLWERWWEIHRDEIIGRSLVDGQPTTAMRGALAGRGRRGDEVPRGRVDNVVSQILPPLLRVTRFEENHWLLQRSLLGVAKATPDKHRAMMAGYLRERLAHENLDVKTSAALALGVVRHVESLDDLSAVARDTSEGRALVGGPVPWQVRSAATLGLGLTAPSRKTATLIDLMNDKGITMDTRSCAAVALGLTTGNTERSALQALRATAASNDDDRLRAHALVALGKLEDATAIPTILEVLSAKRVDNGLRQSAVIATGLIADTSHADLVTALLTQVRTAKDEALRGFAMISLARILGRSAVNPDLDDDAIAALVDELRRPRRPMNRAWAALALGIVAWQRGETPELIGVYLRAEHKSARDPAIKGACALGLGLAGIRDVGSELHEQFIETREEGYRGYAATALGMLRHRAVENTLLEELISVGTPTKLRLQIASGLSLMASQHAADTVLEVMLEEESDEMGWALARALGQLDDMRAVPELAEMVDNLKESVTPRSLACASLGFIGELSLERWNTPFVAGYNFDVPIETIEALLER